MASPFVKEVEGAPIYERLPIKKTPYEKAPFSPTLTRFDKCPTFIAPPPFVDPLTGVALIYDAPEYYDKYQYLLGFYDITLERRGLIPVAGYISPPVWIGLTKSISLNVKESRPSLTEYSILDEGREIPILPTNVKEVTEVLIEGLPLRFKPNKENAITIYERGKETALTLEEILRMRFVKGTYKVTYTPIEDSYYARPKGKEIQVKVIERTEEGALPSTIDAISLSIYRGNHAIKRIGY